MQEQLKDQIVDCRKCGSPYCMENHSDNVVTWFCINCGFTTNTMMLKNTDTVRAFEETLPRLFLDIKFLDNEGFYWYPTVIDKVNEGIGIVFPDGTNAQDWKWAMAAAVPVSYEEREKFKKPDGTYAKYKTSAEFLHFDQHKFADVLEAFGLL